MTPPQTRHGDVVYAFHRLTWDRSVARGHYYAQDRLATALVDADGPGRLVVADHPRSLAALVARGDWRRRSRFPDDALRQHVAPWRLRLRDPVAAGQVERLYTRYGHGLARSASRAGLQQPALLTVNPFTAAFAPPAAFRRITLHLTDDFSAVGESLSPAYEAVYAVLDRSAVRISAVTPRILERFPGIAHRHLSRNGIDPTEWQGPPTAVPELDGIASPRLVYAGAVTDRVDAELVAQVARALPQASVVVAGMILDEPHVAPLRRIANVHFVGQLRRPALTGLVRACDVGLVPHRVTPLTVAMSPLKAYEYLAAGLPVVSTPLPELQRLGDAVACVEPDGFIAAVERALDRGRTGDREREAFLQANSWHRRHADLLAFADV